MKIYIRSASADTSDAENWEAVQKISDMLDSENTAILQKIPPILKKLKLDAGTINLNYGKRLDTRGNLDVIAEYYEPIDLVNITLDPFDTSKAKDREVIAVIRNSNGADSATCINILHEIDKQSRTNMIKNLQRLVKPGGKLYFVAYGDINKDGSDDEIEDFFDEIQTHFANVKKVNNNVVVAINTSKGSTGAIKTSTGIQRR